MSSCDRSLHDGREVACAFLVRPLNTTSDRFDPNPTFQVPEHNNVFFACCAEHLGHATEDVMRRAGVKQVHVRVETR